MKSFFITSIGTGVGKTFITSALSHYLTKNNHNIRVLKPLISGWEDDGKGSDTEIILCSQGKKFSKNNIELTSPWRFNAALSPDMAARLEGIKYSLDDLISFCNSLEHNTDKDYLLIEGVGGVLVPLDDKYTVFDWIKRLEIPVILVISNYLGAINHTLLTIDKLKSNNIPIHKIILSETNTDAVDITETINTLNNFIDEEIIVMPYVDSNNPWEHKQIQEACLSIF